MTSTRSFRQGLARVYRFWKNEKYDEALEVVEGLRASWPGNGRLLILWASLVQLQDDPAHSLDDVKKALEEAVELDGDSPAGLLELGHYADAVEDDARAAAEIFAGAVVSARRLLIDSLLGHARTLLELDRREQALTCLMEALYLANIDSSVGKTKEDAPDVLLRDPAGRILALQLKGPFAARAEDLLQELFPRQTA